MSRSTKPDFPTSLIILGKRYTVTYHDKASDVDEHGSRGLYGQSDVWKREIRIYQSGDAVDMLDTLIHEIVECLAVELASVLGHQKNHEDLTRLSTALADTLQRNGLTTWSGISGS